MLQDKWIESESMKEQRENRISVSARMRGMAEVWLSYNFKVKLQKEFEEKLLENAQHFIGWELLGTSESICLNQSSHNDRIMQEHIFSQIFSHRRSATIVSRHQTCQKK